MILLNLKIFAETIEKLKLVSPQVLASVLHYPEVSQQIIKENKFNNFGDFILKYSERLSPNIRFKSKRARAEYILLLKNNKLIINKKLFNEDKWQIINETEFTNSEKKRFTSERLLNLEISLKHRLERYNNWLRVKPVFELVINNNKHNAYKLFKFFYDLELARTQGRSYKMPLAKTPFQEIADFPNVVKIFKMFRDSAIGSEKALDHWRLWLIREDFALRKSGPRSMSGHNIRSTQEYAEVGGEILEIPNRYYKGQGSYVLTAGTMRVPKYAAVRQQMHILESITYYGRDINKVITEINMLNEKLLKLKNGKKHLRSYYRLNNAEMIIILETLVYFKEKFSKRKTDNQRIAFANISELIEYFLAKIYKHNLQLENIDEIIRKLRMVLRYLKERHGQLSAQYKHINKRRENIAKDYLREIKKLLGKKLENAKIDEALLLVKAIKNGYFNEEAELTLHAKQELLKENLDVIEDFLGKLSIVYTHREKNLIQAKALAQKIIFIIQQKINSII